MLRDPEVAARIRKAAFAESLLDRTTWPERILWSRLRYERIGYRFLRQAVVLGFVADFWCPEAKVVVELDGTIHDLPENLESDSKRDMIMAKDGIECLRFRNSDIYRGMTAVLIRIWDRCYARKPIALKAFGRKANPSSRHEDSVEIKALTVYQEAKRLEQHEKEFLHRYRTSSRKGVKTVQNSWKKEGGL